MYQVFNPRLKMVIPDPAGVTWALCISYFQRPEEQTTACLSMCMENKPNQRLRSLGWEKQSFLLHTSAGKVRHRLARPWAPVLETILVAVLFPRETKIQRKLTSGRNL